MTHRLLPILCLQLAVVTVLPQRLHAQEGRPDTATDAPSVALRLPFEIGQGPRFSHREIGARYSFTGSFLPGVSYGVLELSALGSAIYRNPQWDFGVGTRASVVVLPLLEGALSIRIGAEVAYLVRAHAARLAFGIIPDVSSVLRLGIWGGRDFDAHSNYAMFTIGSDLTTWSDPIGAIVRTSPMEDFDAGT